MSPIVISKELGCITMKPTNGGMLCCQEELPGTSLGAFPTQQTKLCLGQARYLLPITARVSPSQKTQFLSNSINKDKTLRSHAALFHPPGLPERWHVHLACSPLQEFIRHADESYVECKLMI